MSNLLLARWQFGITTIYHFFFVPLTIGLAFLIAYMETMYVTRHDETYKQMAKFWGKLFLINFAVGVVTGILQEFQFGMNWSDYSRFVGDVFGAPLAVEALASFFLESTFLGIWIFGWERLSKGVHLTAIWFVAIGTTISAFWILTANSFMQEPVGYTIRNGHAEMSSFGALITNKQLWLEFPHVWFGALSTGAFFILGVSAWHLLRAHKAEAFKRSFQIAAIVGLASSILVGVVGHEQAQHLVQSQPMKMAASEALWNTSPDVAPWTVVAAINTKDHTDSMQIQIPGMLSILSYNKLHGSVEGINQLQAQYQAEYGPGNYIPPVRVTFWSFRIMVLAGGLMVLLGIWGVVAVIRNKLSTRRALLRIAVPSIALPYIANSMGWVMTEIGRQPWSVFGLLKTSNSVSPTVSAGMVLTTVIGFTLIYGVLAVLDVMLLVRTLKSGMDSPSTPNVASPKATIAPL
ncbi:cytochrome ubiquinol oxidase subunit I [Alicyclobacillus ferrooxydans]|uniref:Cytochrome D ubiquinol oxidase subunit I n=1 Tax=Alicyclobacillus ferrooxydans TaxID=471514 RepID=A0A0N8PPI9_9BACL|nr:cytochrome ubiquinol oxidase subunit I [Alicyclobacillus ferrooxydans]KPV44453.1 cytochrome D ubiquinol oxidase subunit I [Alicyclobacillus ferrooxydans]